MQKALKQLLKALIVMFIILLALIAAVLFITEGPLRKNKLYGENIVDKSKKSDFIHYNTSYIYDSNKKLLAHISNGEGYGNYISYQDIPQNVVNAFIAVEDRTFWENQGYDPEGIGRVVYRYLRSKGKETHGASTITQQVARTQFLSNEKTLDRKFKEIGIAKALSEKYTKKQIMEFYVNNCYFANGIYGIEMASKYYFGKPSKKLTLSQCAYLCSIPNRPSYYDPRKNPDTALKRRNKILNNMFECNMITGEQCEKAKEEEITIIKKKKYKVNDYQSTYAIDCAVKELMDFNFKYHFDSMKQYKKYKKSYDAAYKEAKEKLFSGGYKIYTSLDSNIQKDLQEIVNNEFDNKSKDKEGVYKLQAAMTVIDNDSGKVIAVIGGREQKKFKNDYTYNRTFQSYRQPGSSFKPIAVYTPAIMKDYHANTEVKNIDVSVAKHMNKKEDIENLDGETMQLRQAVEKSINGVAYSVLNDIGVSYGLSFINKMEFSKIVPDDYTLSSSLGGVTYGVNTVEMASSYATLFNKGIFRKPTCITSIVDYKGNEQYKKAEIKKVYSSSATEEMIDILKGVITVGTAKDMKWDSPIPVAGKTGTTNEQKDGWFCGISPYYSISVWVGYDKPKTLDDLYGSTYPADIWKKSMKYLIQDKEFEYLTETDFSTSEDEVDNDDYSSDDYIADTEILKNIDHITKKFDQEENYRNLQKQYEKAKELLKDINSVKLTKEKEKEINELYEQIQDQFDEE